MLRSLRTRLLLWVGVVVVAAIAAVGMISSLGTRMEFRHFLEMERIEEGPLPFDLRGAAGRLTALYRRGGWDGALAALADLRQDLEGGRHLALLAPDGRLLFTTAEELDPGSIELLPGGALELRSSRGEHAEGVVRIQSPRAPVTDALGQVVATLHVLPESRLVEMEAAVDAVPPPAAFLASTNRWMWITVVGAGLVALLATAAVARRILSPVEALTGAARRMAAGELGQRVSVTSRDEVGELARAFNGMAESLERQESLRRQMVSDVAHDLRTPLTNIRGQIEALQDGLLRPGPEVLASLHEEVLFLTRLVRDLQDLSLAEAGELRLELEAVDVGEEIAGVIAALQIAGDRPRIETDVPELPPARADAARFRQIVRNLLDNAWTHTPADGRIVVRARRQGDALEITVRDTGPGIEPEHLPHVFERFYRADGSRARETGGAGLGLAIVRQLATAQGGRAWAESTAGQGATFGFTVPAAL